MSHEIEARTAGDPSTLDAWLAQVYRPEKHRLGILSAGADAWAQDAVDRAVLAGGFAPSRRHARLQPRPGEERVRAADLTSFIERYGHEYEAAVLGRLADDPPAALVAACEAEGVEIVWTNL